MNLRQHLRRRATLLTAALAVSGLAIFSLDVGATLAQTGFGPLLQPAAENTTPTPGTQSTVADKRAENAALLRIAQRKLDEVPTDPVAAEQVTRLKTAENLFAQQEAIDQQIKDLEARQIDVQKQLQSVTAELDPGTTISFIRFDRLVNEQAAEKSRIELAQARVKAAKAALETAQNDLDAREKERQQAQEAAEVGGAGPDAAKLVAEAERATQARALAGDVVTLRQKELVREKLTETVQGLTVEYLDKKVTQFRPLVVFAESDLQDQLKKLTSQEETLRQSLKISESHLPDVQGKWTAAKWRHDAATGDRWLLTEELEALRRDKEKTQDEINVYLAQLLQLDQLRTAWTRLYQLLAAAPQPTADELADWDAETSAALKALIGSTQAHLFRIDELRNELATIAAKAEAAKDGVPKLREAISDQQRCVEQMIRVHEANLVSIDASRRLHGKLRTEIDNGVALVSFQQLAHNVWRQAEYVWGYGLFSTGFNESQRLITVGKVVNVLVLFLAGLVLSRRFSAFFANRLLRRLRLSQDATAVVRTLTFYLLLVSITLAALHKMNVPLTAFTILGGALAIGVGFGSQTLINNFISGLIMLAERPVRIGERVLFGNYDGVIEDVGFRCTKLRTSADHLVTIPNSALINDSIENVGRRRTIQRTLNLQITYDTPRESIAATVTAIRELLEEPGIREPIHPVIGWEKHLPKVFFNDFNAESLNLQIAYHFAPPDQGAFNEHAQKVNFRIFEEFERLGVAFAFSRRTVYFAGNDSLRNSARLAAGDAA
ncbi:MAG: mechanosensitive ion channel domain-containing protein [Pirellulales bacterium]